MKRSASGAYNETICPNAIIMPLACVRFKIRGNVGTSQEVTVPDCVCRKLSKTSVRGVLHVPGEIRAWLPNSSVSTGYTSCTGAALPWRNHGSRAASRCFHAAGLKTSCVSVCLQWLQGLPRLQFRQMRVNLSRGFFCFSPPKASSGPQALQLEHCQGGRIYYRRGRNQHLLAAARPAPRHIQPVTSIRRARRHPSASPLNICILYTSIYTICI